MQRKVSWGQWSYIQNTFGELIKILRNITEQPKRILSQHNNWTKREKVGEMSTSTVRWLEKNYGNDSENSIPKYIYQESRTIRWDSYENRVVKKQTLELLYLLEQYIRNGTDEMVKNASIYKDQLQYWVRNSFIKNIHPWEGHTQVTMTFRKHPIYSQWHNWFYRLYKHGKEKVGFDYAFPLKETFALYEMWCYMRIVRIFRLKGLLSNTSGIFKSNQKGVFLNLSKNRESCIVMKNGMKLYYQRVYQYNSPEYYTYTQQMIPDIVIEHHNNLYIFDPKYRVASNLGTALGEMHKYRDGILLRQTDERLVVKIFILTPTDESGDEELRYFKSSFHQKYKMGAVQISPDGKDSVLSDVLEGIIADT